MILKIHSHILCILPEHGIIHSLLEGIIEPLDDLGRCAFGCSQAPPHAHGEIDPLFLDRGYVREKFEPFSCKKGYDFQLSCLDLADPFGRGDRNGIDMSTQEGCDRGARLPKKEYD